MPKCGNCGRSHSGTAEIRACYERSGRSTKSAARSTANKSMPKKQGRKRKPLPESLRPIKNKQPKRRSGPASRRMPSNADDYVSDVRGHRPRGRPTPTTGEFCNSCDAEIDLQGLCKCS